MNDMENSVMNTGKTNANEPLLFTAALLSYPIAYYYIRALLFNENIGTPGIQIPSALLFTVIFMTAVEVVSRLARHEGAGRTSREHLFWGMILAAQGAALAIHGMHSGSLGIWQIFLWHMTAIYYTAVCTDMLTAGRTSVFLPVDVLTQLFAVPVMNVLLRIKSLIKGIVRPFRAKRRPSVPVALSIAAAVCVVIFAWSQLAAADRNFGRIGSSFFEGIGSFFRQLFRGSQMPAILLSIPVGCYLFAMVCGSLVISGRRLKISEDNFRNNMEPMRRIPAFSAGIVMGALTTVYVIFFSLQAAELFLILTRGGSSGQVLSAPSASEFARNGFQELCRILILNFCVLGFFGFFLDTEHGKKQNPLRKRGVLHLLTGIFALSGIGFTLLAILKIYVYIHLYGFTARRVLSFWFVATLLIVSVLALVRIFRKFHAVPAAVFVMAASFVILVLSDVDGGIIHGEISRYEDGRDSHLAMTELDGCGFTNRRDLADNTQRLIDAGWFTGMVSESVNDGAQRCTIYDVQNLYTRQIWYKEDGTRLYADELGSYAGYAGAVYAEMIPGEEAVSSREASGQEQKLHAGAATLLLTIRKDGVVTSAKLIR